MEETTGGHSLVAATSSDDVWKEQLIGSGWSPNGASVSAGQLPSQTPAHEGKFITSGEAGPFRIPGPITTAQSPDKYIASSHPGFSAYCVDEEKDANGDCIYLNSVTQVQEAFEVCKSVCRSGYLSHTYPGYAVTYPPGMYGPCTHFAIGYGIPYEWGAGYSKDIMWCQVYGQLIENGGVCTMIMLGPGVEAFLA